MSHHWTPGAGWDCPGTPTRHSDPRVGKYAACSFEKDAGTLMARGVPVCFTLWSTRGVVGQVPPPEFGHDIGYEVPAANLRLSSATYYVIPT